MYAVGRFTFWESQKLPVKENPGKTGIVSINRGWRVIVQSILISELCNTLLEFNSCTVFPDQFTSNYHLTVLQTKHGRAN